MPRVILCGPSDARPPRLRAARLRGRAPPRRDPPPLRRRQRLPRIQLERQDRGLFPTLGEYSHFYGITQERLDRAKPDLLVLAPGPINRGVELTPEVADGPQSAILDQVTNGLAVRMAVLYLVSGKGEAPAPLVA